MASTGDRATNLPGLGIVPTNIDPGLRALLVKMKEHLEVRGGLRGDPLDRAVTLRELQSGGLAALASSSNAKSMVIPAQATPATQQTPSKTTTTTPANLPSPKGLTAIPGYAQIILQWTMPTYSGYQQDIVEIWRNDHDDIHTASLAGSTSTNQYIDPTQQVAEFYYWIRFVRGNGSANPTLGPWNASAGVLGMTVDDPAYLQSVLTGSIDDTHLTDYSVSAPYSAVGQSNGAAITAGTNYDIIVSGTIVGPTERPPQTGLTMLFAGYSNANALAATALITFRFYFSQDGGVTWIMAGLNGTNVTVQSGTHYDVALHSIFFPSTYFSGNVIVKVIFSSSINIAASQYISGGYLTVLDAYR